ncbi:hypothetical protein SKAU_G00087970 [Synaphobranchus kaupii]|uniref:Uncharacterized protein n=1 Tax=Synaphobranchus kaupii TaxID=118154 RepID=A0A9Q1FVT2_SYNKA|nr:hypothetical protein SKAU_G00087970 [Synaphobranchus kaupii]
MDSCLIRGKPKVTQGHSVSSTRRDPLRCQETAPSLVSSVITDGPNDVQRQDVSPLSLRNGQFSLRDRMVEEELSSLQDDEDSNEEEEEEKKRADLQPGLKE